ncbi:mitochondrial Complex I (CI) NADH:ubiquinone oxidoreductase subunit 20.9-kDa/NUXM [Andalucia godoyi]|uniref:Mitochondrial Complex I (CI) NADH:ubiquinone oxidoreductase subunit 20.9-kDa/NUXM n=1 Tax=Andalucia godoyi TaxID=505711 RepID=A0A8K0F493_ANDGO|nr:mitochondrial Complex I (CI) NADH:ubiquinone oxidoreductase subunit 20.9-kDa/NUXM [Andalucia godoyi]|eukprot:ANDGO_07321.mRNA.1 mitochondrial Complex I (CI) NADH:ubiquinone oxidoreductase subunit 20.9-kDa/NUXM
MEKPSYPVINPAPTVGQTVSNFSFSDWTIAVTCPAAAGVYGYLAGKPLPKQSAVVAALIGGLGGYFLAYQYSSARLMGLKENSREQSKFGIPNPQ